MPLKLEELRTILAALQLPTLTEIRIGAAEIDPEVLGNYAAWREGILAELQPIAVQPP